jgi:formylglycine-generating enzyme required for sulfatase activity
MFRYLKGALPLFSAGLFGLFTGMPVFKEKNVLNARLIDKNIARVTDSLYAYKYETSNREYNSFLSDLQKNNPGIYSKCLPDTLGWRTILSYCEPMVEYYHRHPAYANYPAVNISYEAAIEYCKWLTDLYNNDPKREFKKVMFTLPTVAEWITAAKGGKQKFTFPWGTAHMRNKQGLYLANFKRLNESFVVSDNNGHPVFSDSLTGIAGGLNDRAFYTAEVKSFYPNGFGLFNMSGNVAEMTLEKGISKGGSFNSYGGEIRIDAVKKYEESSPEIGFRVFMKITEQ